MNRWPNLNLMSSTMLSGSSHDPSTSLLPYTRYPVPLEKPKRPLSAYNFFFHAERIKLLDELPPPPPGMKPKKSHGKLNFDNMAKIIGFRWRNIDALTKTHFDRLALDDKVRYERAMKVYREARARQEEEDILHMLLEPRPLPPGHDSMAPIPLDYQASIAELAKALDPDMVDCIIQTFL